MITIDPHHLRRFHLVMTGVWALAVLPTLLWWHDSVLWVALMSTWANLVGHFGAWQASRAEIQALTPCPPPIPVPGGE